MFFIQKLIFIFLVKFDLKMTLNASTEGSSLLKQTEQVGKKIISGAATVLGNISGEIKEGVGAK